MRATRMVIWIVGGGALAAACFFAGRLSVDMYPRLAVLDQPLPIEGGHGSASGLPAGTTLVYDGAGDNFTRYKVYINVFGREPAATVADRAWLKVPLTAFRVP